MALAAAQVVDALAARLAPLPDTGGRVYTSRAWPLSTLPAWRVTAETEEVAAQTLDLTVQQHSLEVLARGYAEAANDIDDELHDLAAAGLTLLFAPPVPYALQLTGIERDITTENQASVGVITLRLLAIFHTSAAAPETIL